MTMREALEKRNLMTINPKHTWYPPEGLLGDHFHGSLKQGAFEFTLTKHNLLRPSLLGPDHDLSDAYRIVVKAGDYDEAIKLARLEADSIIQKTGDEYRQAYLFLECGERSHGRTMSREKGKIS